MFADLEIKTSFYSVHWERMSWKLSLSQDIHGWVSLRFKKWTQCLPFLIQALSMELIIIHADLPKIQGKIKMVSLNIPEDPTMEKEEENISTYPFLRGITIIW